MVPNICSFCLIERQDTIELFSAEESSKSVVNTIFLCFQIVLTQTNALSVICSVCTNDLNAANRFRLNCLKIVKNNKNMLVNVTENFDLNKETKYSKASIGFCGSITTIVSDTTIVTEKVKIHYKCEICGKELDSNVSLQLHKMKLHNQEQRHFLIQTEKKYQCSKCSYSTNYSQTYVNHLRRHNGERPYMCDCGKTFTQYSSLNAHRMSLHSNSKQFTCPECGKQFKLAYTLKKHLNVHKTGTYICEICNKSLKSKTTLQDHLLRHKNIFNFNCEDCGKTFVTSSELINHKNTHRPKKKFECSLCGLISISKKSLTAHLKRHTGDKAYKCELCDKQFFNSSELREHQHRHTREKPYHCPACAQKFKHSSSCHSHLRTVHNINHLSLEVKKTKLI